MKIYTRIVYQMNDDGTITELESESYDYDGPVSQAFGGDSETSSTTSTDIDTTQVGIESVGDGIGIAAAGDASFNQNITLTEPGAIEDSFEFASEFGGDALDFASDIAQQAGQTAQRAVDVSQKAVSTVATGGATDLANVNMKTIGLIVAGLAAIFIVPRLIKGSA